MLLMKNHLRMQLFIDNLLAVLSISLLRTQYIIAVHLISQFMSTPRSTHYAVVLRILRYIKGTIINGLHYLAYSSTQLRAYCDAD